MSPMDDSNLNWTSFFDVRLNRITSHVDKLTVLACQKCDLLRILKTLSVIVVLIEIVLGEKHPVVNYNFGFISVFPLHVHDICGFSNKMPVITTLPWLKIVSSRLIVTIKPCRCFWSLKRTLIMECSRLLCCNWENFLCRIFRWFYMRHWSKWGLYLSYLILLFSFGIFVNKSLSN